MTVYTSNGIAFQIDPEDQSVLGDWKWKAYNHGHTWYVRRLQSGRPRNVYLHRALMNPAVGLEVDHINRDGLDNRRRNLRTVTHSVNQRNSRVSKHSVSGAKGVCYAPGDSRSKPFRAYVQIDGVLIYLGYFRTLEQAVAVRAAYLRESLGEVA